MYAILVFRYIPSLDNPTASHPNHDQAVIQGRIDKLLCLTLPKSQSVLLSLCRELHDIVVLASTANQMAMLVEHIGRVVVSNA